MVRLGSGGDYRFLETGRARPSPEMVEHLSVVLDIPLRARNSLLNAAGFAPAYTEEPLDGPALAHIRESLKTLVEAHDPFPAYVVDRSWNLLIANTSAVLLTGVLLPADPPLALAGNVLRLFLHPAGARTAIANWAEAASVLLNRLYAECAEHPMDQEMRDLYDEVTRYEGVAALAQRAPGSNPDFLTQLHVHTESVDLHMYTAISTLAAASDVTLAELRLETLLPANPQTADELRAIRARAE